MEKEKVSKIFICFVLIVLIYLVFLFWRAYKIRSKANAESSFGMRSGYVYGNHVYPYPVNGGGYGYGLPLAKMTRCEPGTKYDWFEGYCVPVNDSSI